MKWWRGKKAAGHQKNSQPDENEALVYRRRHHVNDDSFRIGRTIAGESRQNREVELERIEARKKKDRKNVIVILVVLAIIATLAVLVASFLVDMMKERKALEAADQAAAITPTVKIIDENSGDNVSFRVKEFVAHLEADTKTYGYTVDHVVLPLNMAREIVVYIQGRNEYYKLSIDRSSAVQAEDMSHMIKYLNDKNISCTYVDLRVEGRAYYK